jgi:aspartate kinase
MKIFKFGGASVKNAESIRNLAGIIKRYHEPLVIVVSAMGKTTNALEEILASYFKQDDQAFENLKKTEEYHLSILKELFDEGHEIFTIFQSFIEQLNRKLNTEPSLTFNFEYDQVVSFGELISTSIIEAYLREEGIASKWIDIRKYLKTDNTYREAKVNFDLSEVLVKKAFSNQKIYVTQGFIGSTENNLTSTLGREGSDYTAALLAFFLDAESVTVWKDVPGVLNADPKWFDDTLKIDALKYSDAIELAFYGASVIHPKTIQPLKKKNIPLHVKSFVNPDAEGTIIGNVEYNELIPCFIFKMDQMLIDIYPTDLSFIGEDNFKSIFQILAQNSLKVNLMQNTAVHFRLCVNNDFTRIPKVINELKGLNEVKTNSPLELITIRYFDQPTIDRVMVNKELILEQRTQSTIQLLVRDLG